jgi:hypothetical protein
MIKKSFEETASFPYWGSARLLPLTKNNQYKTMQYKKCYIEQNQKKSHLKSDGVSCKMK